MRSYYLMAVLGELVAVLVGHMVSPGGAWAGPDRIEASPHGASMSGGMITAAHLQFGVSVSGTLEQQIEALQRELRLLEFTRDTFLDLTKAISYGYREIAKMLAEHGAKLDVYTASGLGMVKEVRKFLDEADSAGGGAKASSQGVKPVVSMPGGSSLGISADLSSWSHATGPKERHSAFGGYGVTPLHCAARGGSVEVAALLLERGLSISATDSQGDTPLHWAAAQGELEMVMFLVRKGAAVDTTNLLGGTPLLVVARSKPAPAVVKFLLQSGAEPNATDGSGENALHKLAWFGYPRENVEAAQALLNAGADVKAKDGRGRTPLDILLDNQYRNAALVALFQKYAGK